MRSKHEDGEHSKLNEDSRHEYIKDYNEGGGSASKLKSSTMRREADFKTDERHTSGPSNQDNIDEGISNFGRSNSKVSNSKVLTTKRSKQFLLRAGSKGIKKELQMMQEIKELEKDKEVLEGKVEALQEEITHNSQEAVKWKSIMSQKIVYLEDQIKKLKASKIQSLEDLK